MLEEQEIISDINTTRNRRIEWGGLKESNICRREIGSCQLVFGEQEQTSFLRVKTMIAQQMHLVKH